MEIDPEVSANDLLEQYTNGNRNDVIAALGRDHPGLTAMFLVVGITARSLSKADCNSVTNRLMDMRREIAQGG